MSGNPLLTNQLVVKGHLRYVKVPVSQYWAAKSPTAHVHNDL